MPHGHTVYGGLWGHFSWGSSVSGSVTYHLFRRSSDFLFEPMSVCELAANADVAGLAAGVFLGVDG